MKRPAAAIAYEAPPSTKSSKSSQGQTPAQGASERVEAKAEVEVGTPTAKAPSEPPLPAASGPSGPAVAEAKTPGRTPSKGGPPEGWEETFNLILEQRKNITAECDVHGGAIYVKQNNNAQTRYHTLLNSILAPQNKDKVTFEATADIIKKAPTPEEVMALPLESLEESCKKTRFAARKVKAIKDATKILLEKYGGDLPKTMKELTSLPGVGTKSAAFLMMTCWEQVEALKVDVHIHRVCNRLGWVSTTNEEKTRLELESWLPRSHWGVDGLKRFVGFGQEICTAQKPKCGDCAAKERCPSATLP